MTENERNDLFYVCALVEYIARTTKNHRGDIIKALGKEGIKRQFSDAEVNHCLSFEQVSDELVERYKIKEGTFDTITKAKYRVPSVTDIGRLYSIMVEDCAGHDQPQDTMMDIFSSFISDEISKFDTDVYYQNQNYLEESYKAGVLLD